MNFMGDVCQGGNQAFILSFDLEMKFAWHSQKFQHFRSCDTQQLCPSLRSGIHQHDDFFLRYHR
eukprot:UN00776